MDRRTFLISSAGVAAAYGLGLPACLQRKRPPNIVLILADDMGYGDLAVQNADSKIPTPNLDRLAAQGIRFVDAHTTSGVCSPTRYSILTGRYHWRGKLKSGIVEAFGEAVVESGRLTLPALLRKKGYATGCVGKWHLGFNWPFKEPRRLLQKGEAFASADFDWSKRLEGGPVDCGFDYYFGDDTPNFPPYTWIENDRVLEAPSAQWEPSWTPGGEHFECRSGPAVEGWDLTRVLPRLADKAVEWIDRQCRAGRPFFLYFPLTSPHTPIVPSKDFIGRSRAGLYGDWMAQTDVVVGRVLSALEAGGASENTIVIFTSDNGPELYAYERTREYEHYSMLNLRGLKRDLWEGGHRVPFLVRWPGKISPGSVSDEVVCLVDVMATIADIAGFSLSDSAAEDSLSILPILEGRPHAKPLREATVHHSMSGRFAIRRGDWVFIDWERGNDTAVPEWFDRMRGYEKESTPGLLYNLKDDVTEHKNQYSRHPELARELKDLLEKYKREGRSVFHRHK
jgi:arylsulfatase A